MCICEEKQIRIIIVNGSSLSSAPRRPPENRRAAARAGWSAGTISLVFYLIYLHRAAERSSSYYTAGPGVARASRTKLRISGLKPSALWACCCTRKIKWKGWKKKRWRRKDKKRDCSSGRVQIEFHINVCKFPRSC